MTNSSGEPVSSVHGGQLVGRCLWPCVWSDLQVSLLLGRQGHLGPRDTTGWPGLLHRSGWTCIFSYGSLPSQRECMGLLFTGAYQWLMRPCPSSQTGSFLQPAPGPPWSQRKVISPREDFLGALPIFRTKSPGYIFHGHHLQIRWLLWIRLGVGMGVIPGDKRFPNQLPLGILQDPIGFVLDI